MSALEVDLLTDEGNNAVLKLPGRRYPGLLFQGDTVNGVVAQIEETLSALDAGDVGGAKAALQSLLSDFAQARERYETALRARGLGLPY